MRLSPYADSIAIYKAQFKGWLVALDIGCLTQTLVRRAFLFVLAKQFTYFGMSMQCCWLER